ncbi:MAG: T9SS type A sorting domain-containing protein [Bacteroidales bacterium]
MKVGLFKIFFSWLFVITMLSSVAQNQPVLDVFSATENNGIVYLNWRILAGGTCNGTNVLRSTDSLNFTEIGRIFGVCGDLSEPVSYSFIDEEPVANKRNYYRLELGLGNFSETIFTDVIDLEDQAYQVRPNPINTKAKIHFRNPKMQVQTIHIYAINGQLISSIATRDDFFEVNGQTLENGIYVFSIAPENGEGIIKGKMMVQH